MMTVLLYLLQVNILQGFSFHELAFQFQGRTVLLEGLGSSQFCVSTPRLGDTKIFLVDHILDEKRRRNGLSVPKLRLRSSILKVNLRNLKVLWRLEESKAKGSDQGRSQHRKSKSFPEIPKSSHGEPVSSKKGATCDFACSLHHQPVCGADRVLVSLNQYGSCLKR